MMRFLILIIYLFIQQDVPYKSNEEFDIRLELTFKQRPRPVNTTTYRLDETQADYEKRMNTSQLPYLALWVTIKNVSGDEVKMKIIRDGKSIATARKIEIGKEFKLNVGFTDDAKDQVEGYEHIIYFLSAQKKEISRIVIIIDKNGDYLVNGQKRGRI